MRLCFASDTYPSLPHAEGLALYTRTAARSLAARGHEVHVLLGQRGEFRDFTDGAVQIHVRPIRWLPIVARWLPGLGESFCLAWALWRLQRQHHFDVVEFPNWEGVGFISALFRITPIVMRTHTMTMESLRIANRSLRTADKFTIWLERVCIRLARANVTHSAAHREWLRTNLGLPDIEVIPHGIDLPSNNHSASDATLTVLYVGSLTPRKNIPTFLAAIPLVLKQVPNAEFWLVGGTKNSNLEKEFREHHPQIPATQVRFFGYLPEDQLQDCYARCSVYASASVYESFGLTFVEAMAHFKPVVGCAVGGMLDTIENEVNGILVPPNDTNAFAEALIRLLQDSDLRKRFGAAGHRRAHEQFSAQRMAADLEAFYSKVISKEK